MSIGGYPAGAEYDREAPWNRRDDVENDHEPVEVALTVYATVEIPLIVKTDDYEIDPWGYFVDVNDKEALARENIHLPDGWRLESVDDVTLEECYTMYRRNHWFKD